MLTFANAYLSKIAYLLTYCLERFTNIHVEGAILPITMSLENILECHH